VNRTALPRRAVNHVFTIPFFKQQIRLAGHLDAATLSPEARDLLGFNYPEPTSVDAYLASRESKATS